MRGEGSAAARAVAESGHMLRGAGETHDCRIERARTMDSRRLVYNCMTMRTALLHVHTLIGRRRRSE